MSEHDEFYGGMDWSNPEKRAGAPSPSPGTRPRQESRSMDLTQIREHGEEA